MKNLRLYAVTLAALFALSALAVAGCTSTEEPDAAASPAATK